MMRERPNLNYIAALAGEDIEFQERFIQIVKTEFPQEIALYYKHIKLNDFLAASHDVHKIKHKINIIGLDQSHALASQYEEELRDGKTDMQLQFDGVLKLMENYIKRI